MKEFAHKLYLFGCRICDRGSTLAGHPAMILLAAVFCAAWFLVGGHATENTLTLILSVLSITLTQMVLNQQRRSEIALHMKIDELILAVAGARDEMAGIETKSEDELEALRRNPPGEAGDEGETSVCEADATAVVEQHHMKAASAAR